MLNRFVHAPEEPILGLVAPGETPSRLDPDAARLATSVIIDRQKALAGGKQQ